MAHTTEEISCLSVSFVKPIRPTKKHRMLLSSFDLACHTFQYMNTIHFYNFSSEGNIPSMLEKLKSSLSSLLVQFYPLAGRLVSEGQGNRFQLECNDLGVEFIHASANVRLKDIEDNNFQPRYVFRKLVKMGKSCRSDNCDAPLMSIQVTEFVGGLLAIGFAVSHVVADGYSYVHFLRSWAEVCRGLPISVLPFLDRSILKLDEQNIHKDLQMQDDRSRSDSNITAMNGHDLKQYSNHEINGRYNKLDRAEQKQGSEMDEAHGVTIHDENASRCIIGHSCAFVYGRFTFSGKMLENIQRLTGERGRPRQFSSFVSFSAHFWRCMVKAKQVGRDEIVYFVVVADCRNRMSPALPPNYFGSCIYINWACTTAGRLLSEEPSYAASLVSGAVNSCTLENIMDWIKRTERNKYHVGCEYDEIVEKHQFVMAIGSPKFDLYALDFGCGRPVSVQQALIDECGSMSLMAGKDGKGSIEAGTALSPKQMHRFETLLYKALKRHNFN